MSRSVASLFSMLGLFASVLSSHPAPAQTPVTAQNGERPPSPAATSGTPKTQNRTSNTASLLGFTGDHARTERALEARFDAVLRADNLRNWMQRLSAHPHHVGSPYGKENAEWIASQFRSWGYSTEIKRYDVLFSTPKSRLLEMSGPRTFRAKLEEPELKEDATSRATSGALPTYNAYSIDGDVTAPLVYVNYGVPKDYETLAERGVDVKGKIVIARYGGSWRGIKPKVASEHGAVGCLIYSDPRDDGYFQGDTYPKGAFRNADGAQRGSVADMPQFPGDPLTPGIGATPDAKRLDRKDAPTITKIPTLPISYADAQPLLATLTGPVAPAEWRGALPITYHLGPGTANVHLKLTFDWKTVPAYDIIATLTGSDLPNEWILRGNHHDAWVFGAEDPISGTVALMEEARGVAELTKTGWKPRRTLVYCVWDGEEPGLLGSTEYVESNADLLTRNAVCYINSDSNGRGFLGVGGSHTLERFVNEVARDVTDPQTKRSVSERQRASRLVNGMPEAKREARQGGDAPISALGSGSDYSAFLQHLGIASLNLGYGGESAGGSYHSIFDSFDWYVRFGDPDFAYGVALAQTAGRMMLRMGNADVLPFEFMRFASTVDGYVREIGTLAASMREETTEQNRIIADGTLKLTYDPKETHIVPAPKPPVPFFSLAPLQNALTHLRDSANAYASALASALPPASGSNSGGTTFAPLLPQQQTESLDAVLIATERALLLPSGLPRRSWYRHAIYAPGFYTGYGVKTLPGVREAIEERQYADVEPQVASSAAAIERMAAQIDHASQTLKTAAPKP